MSKAIFRICVLSILLQSLNAQTKIAPSDAKQHIGEDAIVCGTVANINVSTAKRGMTTNLNLDVRYPKPSFTVVIIGDSRYKFGDVEEAYLGKRICASGKIAKYKSIPEIEAKTPSQIVIEQ
jgi:hypothetical protein